ncbi:MAG: ThiF family adenylyltransferase [Clostridiales Family XIII bacterium]|jgi:adenylyltransferase/sulfurtransferase|nr:ThiF family adenylyltransferase [Clostridiales Family XIII bacterium]
MDFERYARQIIFPGIGEAGQRKLSASAAAVIGIGALGTVIAEELVRAGVGRVVIADRDYVNAGNLHRQFLFDEQDAAEEKPKAAAAAEHLAAINSQVKIEPIVCDIDASNIEQLVRDVDIILDGADNFEVRMLMNESAHKYKKPYVYGAALGAQGATMNILPEGWAPATDNAPPAAQGATMNILPEDRAPATDNAPSAAPGPCLRCLIREVPGAGTYPTCSTAGVIAPITAVVASMQVAEAIKILIGSPDVRRSYRDIDLWAGSVDDITIERDSGCPVCGVDGGRYEYLGRVRGAHSAAVCGRDEYQITPGVQTPLDLAEFDDKLRRIDGAVSVKSTRFSLSFEGAGASFVLFPDGRAIIRNVKDEAQAKSVYAEYIGL